MSSPRRPRSTRRTLSAPRYALSQLLSRLARSPPYAQDDECQFEFEDQEDVDIDDI